MCARILKPKWAYCGLFLALCIVASAPARGAEQAEQDGYLIDPGAGQVDGQVAVAVVPAVFDGERYRPIDPTGYQAYLAGREKPNEELVYPAGAWFVPPVDGYVAWIEGAGQISPYLQMFSYGGGEFRGRGLVVLIPVGPAGTVVLDPKAPVGESTVVRLMASESHLNAPFPRPEVMRSLPAAAAAGGVQMPAGTVVGVLYEPAKGAYSALSRPVEVVAGETVELEFERPVDSAHVVAVLHRRPPAESADEYDGELALMLDGKRFRPELTVRSSHHLYGFWYDLPSGEAELQVTSARWRLEPQKIDLIPGRIERLRGELRPLPSLDVTMGLPPSPVLEPLSLELRRLPGGELVRREALAAGRHSHSFDLVPAVDLEVHLITPLGTLRRRVDLSDGEDHSVYLEAGLLELWGHVYHAEDAHPATLYLNSGIGEPLVVETDEDGAYRAILLSGLYSARVELAGSAAPPFFEFFHDPIRESGRKDFEVPANGWVVHVVDAETGSGVPSARVIAFNRYVDDDVEKTVAQDTLTDESGLGELPPLRSGSVEVRASADGYRRMREPLRATVDESEAVRELELRLRPLGETAALRVLLPDGSPAAGASGFLMESLAPSHELFSGKADSAGVVELPRSLEGAVLLITHPAAGFDVRVWRPLETEEPADLRLPARSTEQLVVRVIDPWSREPVRHAELALWVEGIRLSGGALQRATSTRGLTDVNGYWTALNLPAGEIAVLAWGFPGRSEALAGVLDTQAIEIDYPWPAVIEVFAAE